MSWRDAYRHGSLLLLPPPDLGRLVDGLRRRYDPASHRVCRAHVTLTQPFVQAVSDLALARVEEVVASHPPMVLSYGPVERLGGSVVVFRIEPRAEVLALREALHSLGLFNLSLPFTKGFVPHMTISEREVEGPLRPLEGLPPARAEGSFLCSRVDHLVPDDGFVFRPRRSFLLGLARSGCGRG